MKETALIFNVKYTKCVVFQEVCKSSLGLHKLCNSKQSVEFYTQFIILHTGLILRTVYDFKHGVDFTHSVGLILHTVYNFTHRM